jgi:hypothetical protein
METGGTPWGMLVEGRRALCAAKDSVSFIGKMGRCTEPEMGSAVDVCVGRGLGPGEKGCTLLRAVLVLCTPWQE